MIVSIFLAVVLIALAGIHFYWALGGRWAMMLAIPKFSDGRPVFVPGPLACGFVAFGLGGLAYVCLAQSGLLWFFFGPAGSRRLLLGVGGLFLLRGLGDFKYMGLFRQVTGTDFSRWDRTLYTPLCLGISLLILGLAEDVFI